MNKQPLIIFVLLVGLAIASGPTIAHSRADAGIDGRPGWWATAQETQPVQGESATRPLVTERLRVSEPDAATGERVNQTLFNLPLRFIANAGQTDPAVRFTVKGAGHTLFFTDDEVVFSASILEPRNPKPETRISSLVRLRFLGANPYPTIEGLAPMPGVANFFLGNDPARWRVNVPTYGAVAYRDLYPGIDLIYHGTEGHLKSEFRVAPGADPAAILMAYSGLEALRLRKDGALILQTPLGELIETAPLIYQEMDGARQAIAGGYALLDPRVRPIENLKSEIQNPVVGFYVAAYDPARPLVIDPSLAYSTYLGGRYDDEGHSIAVDSAGNAYVTGGTTSDNFPTYDEMQTYRGNRDVFVTQIISVTGVYTYGYSTYLGGSNDDDEGYGIALDSAGNAYVTGETYSSDFPTHDEIQTHQGGSDAFVTQIISTSGGYAYGYSTYLGGSGNDYGRGIAVDGDGNAYVAGYTESSNFPTRNEIQTDQGGDDAFVTKIISASGGYTYSYSSYLGGGSHDHGQGIAVDGNGNAYVTGKTESDDFPTSNEIQTDPGDNHSDAFVTKVISTSGGYAYGYSTYLGGRDDDIGRGIAVDGNGNAYVTGETNSDDFPTHNPMQTDQDGDVADAFVTQVISASGVYTYGYSTYLGGGDDDEGYGIAVDGVGNAYVTGQTESEDFPTHNPIDDTTPAPGDHDVFVTKIISASGVYTYSYSTCLGGSGNDYGRGIAVDNDGNAYVTGETESTDFPTHNEVQTNFGGGNSDAFVVKINPRDVEPPPGVYLPLIMRAYP